MNKEGIIYCARNILNNKVYIGQTSRKLETRKKEHESYASEDSKYPFHRAIYKYGKENFEWTTLYSIISSSTKELKKILCELEIQEIAKYKNTLSDQVYNASLGGISTLGYKHTLEQIENNRKAQLGKKLSQEHIQHILDSKAKNPLSQESRDKLRTQLGKTGKDHPAYGYRHTEETKKIISKTSIERYTNEEYRKNQSEKIRKAYENPELHNRLKEAQRKSRLEHPEVSERRIASMKNTCAYRAQLRQKIDTYIYEIFQGNII